MLKSRKRLWIYAPAILSLLFVSLLLFRVNSALSYIGLCCGKCGGNMPLNIPGGGIPETYEFRVKFSPSFMYMKGIRKGFDDVSLSQLKGYMALPNDMRMYMLMFSSGFSFTDRFFGALMFMWEMRDMSMTYSDMMRKKLGVSSFTMRTIGMRDTMLMFKYLIWADDILIPTEQFSFLFGANLPTGSFTEDFDENPNPNLVGKLQPYAMQLGSGTFDPVLGFLYQGRTSPLWWGINLMGVLRPFKNELGYSLGHEGRYDLYLMYQVRYDTVLEIQVNGTHHFGIEGENKLLRSQYEGKYPSPLFEAKNYGGHKIYLTAGVQFQPVPLQIINLQLSFPALQYYKGYQMKEMVKVGIFYYIEIPTRASIRYVDEKQKELGF